MNKYIETAEQYLMHTYIRYPIVLEKGEGVYLYDTDGKKYLDFASGIAVFALGYGNDDFNQALKNQIDNILHTSNLYYSIPLSEAASKFSKASGFDKVFFTNSGTEAIEGAIKLARKYAYKKSPSAGSDIISMNQSFHGRSLGALSVTGQPKYQEAFKPLIGGVVFAEFNNLQDAIDKITDRTCAVILEPIQGEGGIHPADIAFLKGLKEVCEEKDILLIFDEIQCGMGRTGSMFAWQKYGIKPDIIAAAKALGCGVPVGAFAASDKVAKAFEPGDHGTTYGGNPFTMAAVSKVFDLYDSMDVLGNVSEISVYLEDELDKLVQKYPFVKERRGVGLMQGLELDCPVNPYILKAMDNGLILISAGPNVLRFVPPLIIKKENVDEMIRILDICFHE